MAAKVPTVVAAENAKMAELVNLMVAKPGGN